MSKKTWTDAELDTLARALIEKLPSRGFATIDRPYDIVLSDTEFTPVMKEVMPLERHGARPRLSRLKRDLCKAFMRLSSQAAARAQEGTQTRKTKVHWSGDEWQLCALSLHVLCPELNLVKAPSLEGVSVEKLNQAASMMAPGRERTFKRVADVADRLLAVYAQARHSHDSRYFAPGDDTSMPTAVPKTAPVAPSVTASTVRPGIYWTAEEYRAIAKKLQHLYPGILTDGHAPGLTITELNEAIRASLPQERQRRMANQAHIVSFGRRLRDTLDGKPLWTEKQFEDAKLVPSQNDSNNETETGDWRKNPRVLWSSDEWDTLLRKLFELDTALEARFDWLTLAQLNEAASLVERPRKFYSVHGAKPHLEAARARVKAAPRFTSETSAPVVAMNPEPASQVDVFGKITWSREEWLRVAEELHRLYPYENYPKRGSLVGLETEDVAFAQERVLPLSRQRRHLKVVSFSTLKAPLLQAFQDLAAKLDNKNSAPSGPVLASNNPNPTPAQVPALALEPAPAPAPAPGPAVDPVPPAALTPPPVPPAVLATPAPTPPVAGTTAAPAIDPYRAAFEPLVNLLVAEVAAKLRPLIGTMVAEALQAVPAIPAAPLAPAPAAAPSVPAAVVAPATPAPVKHYGDEKPRVEKPRRLTVGIVVNRASQYQHELEKEFPEISVRAVEHINEIERLAQCDKVIHMIRFSNHSNKSRIKRLLGDKFTECHGAMSELKRIISIWLKSQGLAMERVA